MHILLALQFVCHQERTKQAITSPFGLLQHCYNHEKPILLVLSKCRITRTAKVANGRITELYCNLHHMRGLFIHHFRCIQDLFKSHTVQMHPKCVANQLGNSLCPISYGFPTVVQASVCLQCPHRSQEFPRLDPWFQNGGCFPRISCKSSSLCLTK